MLLAEKPIKFYWQYFQLPFYILLAWTLLGSILAFINFAMYQSIFAPLLGWMVQVLLYAYAGFIIYEEVNEATLGHSAWSGALTGVFIGFIGAIIGIIMMFTLPAMTDMIISQTLAKGVTLTTAQINIMKYMSFTSLISGPIMSGVIGAVCGLAGGALAKFTGGKK